MNQTLSQIKSKVYDKIAWEITQFETELESKEYDACRFLLNEKIIVNRTSKITPKKMGQFVTFWKRNEAGITTPLNNNDQFDFYIINTRKQEKLGQFVFPKSILISKGIISTTMKDGKRGFRVYPSWDIATNKQALKTQKWQLDYFYEVGELTTFDKVINLYC